jgi:hypothetical protein
MSNSMRDEAKPLAGQTPSPGTPPIKKLEIVKRDLPPTIEEFGERPVYYTA